MNNREKIERLNQSIIAQAPIEQLEQECEGLNLDEFGEAGRTPLMTAAACGYLEVIQWLVRRGASINGVGCEMDTPLHDASGLDERTATYYLILLGAKLDAEAVDGTTPLMCAAAGGFLEVVKLLLEHGADRAKRDCRGMTASDIAREKGKNSAADLIDSYTGLGTN